MNTTTARPIAGHPLIVLLRGVSTTLSWGEDVGGRDVVASEEGRVLAWADPDECHADVVRWGWEPSALDAEPTRMDLTPALEWRARQRRALDPESALNAWNLAGDVARSTGTPWGDRGRVADYCHDRLTVACLPWLVGKDAYAPRWSVAEERYLHRRLNAAFTLFDAQFPHHHRRRARSTARSVEPDRMPSPYPDRDRG